MGRGTVSMRIGVEWARRRKNMRLISTLYKLNRSIPFTVKHCFGKAVEGIRMALNEIMALCTPARWAYSDVVPKTDGDEENLEFDSGRMPAALRLNTAELNTLTCLTSSWRSPAPSSPPP